MMDRWRIADALEALSEEAKELERVRLQILQKRSTGKKAVMITILSSILLGMIFSYFFDGIGPFFATLFFGAIALIVVINIYFSKGKRHYRFLYKHRFLPRVVHQVEPNLAYEATKGISQSVFMNSGLYGRKPDRYSCEDLFTGKIGDTKIAFCEVHAEEKKTRKRNNRTETYWTDIFKGLFVTADFHKEFRSPVSVMPDIAEKNFGWFGKKLQKMTGGVQRMENPEFENMFVVRGRDPVETRYILTPQMQQALVNLRKRTNDAIRIGFSNSRVWISIPNRSNWFEPNIHVSVSDRDQLKMLLGQMRTCTAIVDELDLNKRIWTKR